KCDSNSDLFEKLLEQSYVPQAFPGCITDIKAYLDFIEGRKKFNKDMIKGYGKHVIEGYGITMRLNSYTDEFLKEIIAYLNSNNFLDILKEKFEIDEFLNIETAIQKNLNKYEISPHCDTSRKALTYMVNIYTDKRCEDLSIHTHLLKFKEQYRYLSLFWETNNVDPVWVPWDWCETVKCTSSNNSITIFKPSHETLHAVKLDYDHLEFQRNQIYGNLWYEKSKKTENVPWQDLDIVNRRNVGFIRRALSKLGL
ncbi:hypothetical protein, partial [Zooshikella harenae]